MKIHELAQVIANHIQQDCKIKITDQGAATLGFVTVDRDTALKAALSALAVIGNEGMLKHD